MDLIEALREKPSGPPLAERIEAEIKVRAHEKLKHATDLFPQFTDHSIDHSDRVIENLNWLIPEHVKKQLNAWEIYFLVAAAYLHDLGMIEGCPDPAEDPNWQALAKTAASSRASRGDTAFGNPRSTLRSYIRDRHHVRTEEYIQSHAIELGLRASDTPHEAWIVGRIARGHRKENLGDKALFGQMTFGIDYPIRLDLLAAYLRLADELDITAFRTPLAEHDVLLITDPQSVAEWSKHYSLSGVCAEQGVIFIEGVCSNPDVYMWLLEIEGTIREKLDEINSAIPRVYVFGDSQWIQDPFPYQDVRLRLRHEGYYPVVAKFELQDEEIIRLIFGDRLYSERTACVRELLQNAVDTCREAALLRPMAWTPEILISEDRDLGVFTISDNGMGMDLHIVQQYFSRVGSSYYRSSEFKGGFRPISQFGIGFLSCFMLADRIEIESKREGSDPIRLDLVSPTQPFVPRRGIRAEPGTEVRLYLKAEVKDQYADLVDWAAHYAKHVSVPVKVIDRDGTAPIISMRDMMPTADDLAQDLIDRLDSARMKEHEVRRYLESKKIEDYYVSAEFEGIRVGVVLLDKLFADFKFDEPGWWTSSHGAYSRIYQDGFYVSNLRAALMGSDLTWIIVNLTGEVRFELTADRSRYAGENLDVWRKIYSLYSRALEDFYVSHSTDGGPREWWDFHIRYYDSTSSEVPEALEASASENAVFCVFSRRGFEAVSLYEVRRVSVGLHWARHGSHSDLALLRNSLSEADHIVVSPPELDLGIGRWIWPIMRVNREMDLGALLEQLDIQVEVLNVFDANVVLIDAGYRLGPWGLALGWPSSAFWDGVPALFDARHPLSQALRRAGDRRIPSAVKLLATELFEEQNAGNPARFLTLQQELVAALHTLGVLDGLVDGGNELDGLAPEHACPYPSFVDKRLKI